MYSGLQICILLFRILSIEKDALLFLCGMCDGDARVALNALETAVQAKQAETTDTLSIPIICVEHVKEALQKSHIQYDRAGQINK